MKKIVTLLTLILIAFTPSAHANGAGLPAFFKINDKLAISNPIQTFGITAQSFLIPQDIAPETYVVKQPITFEIDQDPLQSVIPEELLKRTKYTWDFGDGAKAEGLSNTHTYTKTGSYILILTINVYEDGATDPTKFVDSFLLNIVPNKEYKNLPHATIMLNNEQIQNKRTLKDINFNDAVNLDASQSQSPTKIVQYLWNFGDGETSNQPVIRHKYKSDAYFETIVLRIKDSNGYISDAYVGVRNNSEDPAQKKKSQDKLIMWASIGLSVCILLIIIGVLAKKKKQKKKNNY